MANAHCVSPSRNTQPHSDAHTSEARALPVGSSAKLLKMGQACREFGCSPGQLRWWIKQGDVEAVRIGTLGKWRVVRESLESFLGLPTVGGDSKESQSVGTVGIYARRSSPTRTDREALDRQIADLLLHCQHKLGLDPNKVKVFSEQASGMVIDFTGRKALGSAYEAAKRGELKTLVVRDKSRIARIPGGESLFVRILADHGCQVQYVADFVDCEEDNKEDITMLMSFLTVITNRQSSKKAAYNRVVLLSEEAQKFIMEKHRAGLSLKKIAEELAKAGIQGVKNNGTTKPIRDTVVFKFIRQQEKLRVVSGAKKEVGSLDQWFRDRVRKAPISEWVRASELLGDYVKVSGQSISPKAMGDYLRSKGLGAKLVQKCGENYRVWTGVALKP